MNAPFLITSASDRLDVALAQRTAAITGRGLLTPTTDPVRVKAEHARLYMRIAINAFRSYDECEGSEGLRIRYRHQKAMAALAWKTLDEARALRGPA